MLIHSIPSGPFETNAYVIGCENTHRAAIIDPAPGSTQKILAFLALHQLNAEKILLTHSHMDHIADVSKLKEKLNVSVFIHPEDAGNLQDPGSDLLPLFFPIEGVEPDGFLEEGDVVTIGDLQFEVIHTPGHTPGGVCFYHRGENVLISGDTLFKGTIGNLSFPTARPELMWPSLDKLAKLPAETKVYPGHGGTTTIGEEKWLPNAKKMFG